MKKLAFLALIAMAAAPTMASAQQKGDWVLGQWRGGAKWFPGVVQSRQGNMVRIQYDDGTFETRPVNQVRRYNWHVGSKVECRWTDGQWYGATITAMAGDGLTINVLYDDGDRQHTQTGKCRSN